jgi:hypothetical protein
LQVLIASSSLNTVCYYAKESKDQGGFAKGQQTLGQYLPKKHVLAGCSGVAVVYISIARYWTTRRENHHALRYSTYDDSEVFQRTDSERVVVLKLLECGSIPRAYVSMILFTLPTSYASLVPSHCFRFSPSHTPGHTLSHTFPSHIIFHSTSVFLQFPCTVPHDIPENTTKLPDTTTDSLVPYETSLLLASSHGTQKGLTHQRRQGGQEARRDQESRDQEGGHQDAN